MYRHIYVIKTSGQENEKQSVYEFNTQDKAIIDMHNLHGVALKNENLQATFSLVLDEKGVEITRLAASIPDPNNKRVRYEINPRVYWLTVKNGVEDFKIAAYETKQLARGNFHTRYAACRSDITCTKATVACINGDGVNLELQVWDRDSNEQESEE